MTSKTKKYKPAYYHVINDSGGHLPSVSRPYNFQPSGDSCKPRQRSETEDKKKNEYAIIIPNPDTKCNLIIGLLDSKDPNATDAINKKIREGINKELKKLDDMELKDDETEIEIKDITFKELKEFCGSKIVKKNIDGKEVEVKEVTTCVNSVKIDDNKGIDIKSTVLIFEKNNSAIDIKAAWIKNLCPGNPSRAGKPSRAIGDTVTTHILKYQRTKENEAPSITELIKITKLKELKKVYETPFQPQGVNGKYPEDSHWRPSKFTITGIIKSINDDSFSLETKNIVENNKESIKKTYSKVDIVKDVTFTINEKIHHMFKIDCRENCGVNRYYKYENIPINFIKS